MSEVIGFIFAVFFSGLACGVIIGLNTSEDAMVKDCTKLGKTIIDGRVLSCLVHGGE